MLVDVGTEGDDDLHRVRRIDGARPVVGGPEDGIRRRILLRYARAPEVMTLLVGGAIGEVVVVAHLDQAGEGLAAVERPSHEDLVAIIGPADGLGVVEVVEDYVEDAVGSNERLRELVLVTAR